MDPVQQGCSNCCHLLFSPKGGIPTLRDLSLISVPSWYLLGLQLGISGDELDTIEKNYSRDNHMCKVKMFGTWLRVDTRPTYIKLAKALVAVGNRTNAEAVCTTRGKEVTLAAFVVVYYNVLLCCRDERM